MTEHSLKVLEFPEFLDLLVKYCCTEAGRERLRGLRPCRDQTAAFEQTPLSCIGQTHSRGCSRRA